MFIPGVKISSKLSEIYRVESKKYKECPGIDFLFNKICNSNPGQKKRINVYTIKSFLTLEDIINQNNLDDISLKVLNNLVNERIKEIEKEAIEIKSIEDIFKSS